MIDEDAPHHLRGERVELLPVIEGRLILLHQPQPGLVDERRGLQRMAAPLAPEERVGDLPQLAVDDRRQRIERGAVAVGPPRQEMRHLTVPAPNIAAITVTGHMRPPEGPSVLNHECTENRPADDASGFAARERASIIDGGERGRRPRGRGRAATVWLAPAPR